MKNYLGIIVLLIAVGLISCNKEEFIKDSTTEISTKSLQLAANESVAENAVAESNYEADFFMNAEQALIKRFGMGNKWKWMPNMRYKRGQCPDVTVDTITGAYPKSITLNYGDSTVLNNGRVLSGIIEIYISAQKYTDGAYREISYQNFKVDTIAISGTSRSTFTGDNVTNRLQQLESNLVFTFDNGLVITRTAQKTREWVEGLETDTDQSDDKIQITGFINASTNEGDVYEKTIIVPLIKLGDCKYIVEGIVEITENSTLVSKIDYGNGECDNVATLTQNGETIDIELKGNNGKMNKGGNGNKGQQGNNGNGNGNNQGKKGNGKG